MVGAPTACSSACVQAEASLVPDFALLPNCHRKQKESPIIERKLCAISPLRDRRDACFENQTSCSSIPIRCGKFRFYVRAVFFDALLPAGTLAPLERVRTPNLGGRSKVLEVEVQRKQCFFYQFCLCAELTFYFFGLPIKFLLKRREKVITFF